MEPVQEFIGNNKKNNEEQLIFCRMVEGDREAFRFFFEKYYTDLCNLINVYIHNEVMAEEIAQFIFIYLWEKKENIKIESSLKGYLLKASKNKSLNYLRNEKTKLNVHGKLLHDKETTYEMPANAMDTRQLREIIYKSVNNLPNRRREIFRLAKEKELSYKEIATELGISVKTVENQMGLALKKLRVHLRPYYNDIVR